MNEQFPMKPWIEATPNQETAEQYEHQEGIGAIDDPFDQPGPGLEVPEDIKNVLENLQKKVQETKLPEIHIEE